MIYQGRAIRLTDVDLPRIADEIGVGEDILHAFIEVETPGTGFDSRNRVIMLFEPHIFYRLLKGSQRASAVAIGVAYEKWGTKRYPKDSYTRLVAAMEINPSAALESCSWGMGQIMGSNFSMLGYGSVEDMVEAFADSEANQLEGMIKFIKHNHLDDDLRHIENLTKSGRRVTSMDWISVVRVYNGSGFARNNYHTRIATAYNKWLQIKDTDIGMSTSLLATANTEELGYPKSDETSNGSPAITPPVVVSKPADDGIQNSSPASGAVNEPDAKEVKMSAMSSTSKGITFTTVGTALILALKEAWGSARNETIAGAQYALAHLPMVLLIITLAAIGIWCYNEAMKRKDARTNKVIDIAADKNKHDVIIT